MITLTFELGMSYVVNTPVREKASRSHRMATGDVYMTVIPTGAVMRCDLIDTTGHAYQRNDDGSFSYFGTPSCLADGDVSKC